MSKTRKRPAITNRQELMRFSQDCVRAYKAGNAIPPMPAQWRGHLELVYTDASVQIPSDLLESITEHQYRNYFGTPTPTNLPQSLHRVRDSYAKAYAVLVKFWEGGPITQAVPFSGTGNTKLPYWSYSALAIVTCPGMGECANFCYTLKSWRNAFAWLRQLINTLRLHSVSGRNDIVKSWHAIPQGETVRLYVDGDFDSVATMRFWFSLMEMRPDLRVYGYSKSWALFIAWEKSGRPFPANYILNLSSGSRYNDSVRQAVANLPIVRGEFIGVDSPLPMPKGNTSAEIRASADWIPYQNAVRQAAQAAGYPKVFVCPGKCGDCGIKAHACGNTQLTIPVAIAIH
jgi:hypothetical protein